MGSNFTHRLHVNVHFGLCCRSHISIRNSIDNDDTVIYFPVPVNAVLTLDDLRKYSLPYIFIIAGFSVIITIRSLKIYTVKCLHVQTIKKNNNKKTNRGKCFENN